MPLINSARDVRMGAVQAKKVYRGDVLVWPSSSSTPSPITGSLTSSGRGREWVTVTGGQSGGAAVGRYVFYSSSNGGPWIEQYSGGPGPHEFNMGFSTAVRFRIEGYTAGGILIGSTTTNTVTTGARPQQQLYFEASAAGHRTYDKNGVRSDAGNLMYFGTYSSNRGTQKSYMWWDFPDNIRWWNGCVSIDRIDIAIWGLHVWTNTSTNADLVIWHSHTNPGSTGPLDHGGNDWPFRVPDSGWCGTWVQPNGWNEGIQDLWDPGRKITMAEEFRVQGALGIGLVQRTGAQSGYGYCAGPGHPNYPRMRMWYTVNT